MSSIPGQSGQQPTAADIDALSANIKNALAVHQEEHEKKQPEEAATPAAAYNLTTDRNPATFLAGAVTESRSHHFRPSRNTKSISWGEANRQRVIQVSLPHENVTNRDFEAIPLGEEKEPKLYDYKPLRFWGGFWFLSSTLMLLVSFGVSLYNAPPHSLSMHSCPWLVLAVAARAFGARLYTIVKCFFPSPIYAFLKTLT